RRPVVAKPERLRLPDGLDPGTVPTGREVHGWQGGETAARQRANDWFSDGLAGYADDHDALAADRTSQLSPYLHLGNLSPLELAHQAAQRSGDGPEAFVRQLAWRDFHHQVLAARPAAAWDDLRHKDDRWSDPG